MKVYYYTYTIILPNSKEERLAFCTSNVTEVIELINENRDKYYLKDHKIMAFENGIEINTDIVIHQFYKLNK